MRISDWSSDVCSSDLPALVERGWALAKALFAQPEEVKRAYHVPGGGGQRGYTPLGTEIARDATENDLKEFWHTGRDLHPGHTFTAAMPDNIRSENRRVGDVCGCMCSTRGSPWHSQNKQNKTQQLQITL